MTTGLELQLQKGKKIIGKVKIIVYLHHEFFKLYLMVYPEIVTLPNYIDHDFHVFIGLQYLLLQNV